MGKEAKGLEEKERKRQERKMEIKEAQKEGKETQTWEIL